MTFQGTPKDKMQFLQITRTPTHISSILRSIQTLLDTSQNCYLICVYFTDANKDTKARSLQVWKPKAVPTDADTEAWSLDFTAKQLSQLAVPKDQRPFIKFKRAWPMRICHRVTSGLPLLASKGYGRNFNSASLQYLWRFGIVISNPLIMWLFFHTPMGAILTIVKLNSSFIHVQNSSWS